jgi:formylglycine-generating enzyme required for sulfatase activity
LDGTLPHPEFDNLLKAFARIIDRSRAVQPGHEIKADEAAKKRREEEERLRQEQEKRERRAREEAEEREREEQERIQRGEEERKEQERKRQEQERLYREEEEKKVRERKAREEAEKRKREEQERPKTFTNSIGMKLSLIPAGEFYRGSEEYDWEKPVHTVRITNPFFLGTYPVTQREWKAVMGDNPSYFKGADLPVEQVSWDEVQEFITKLNAKEGADKYRLPSEAEWEYACRAGTTTRYSFGDSDSKLGEYAWYAKNSDDETHPVGQKKPNSWGLYDMNGNVWEWVQDTWHYNYEGAPTDGSVWEGRGSNRVFRGGCWYNVAARCSSSSRYHGALAPMSTTLAFAF